MRKFFLVLSMVLIPLGSLCAENMTLYAGTGANRTELVGATLGGDIWHFLLFQLDVSKYVKKDSSLSSEEPTLDRSDFLGVSINFALKIPIHYLPSLHNLKFIEPYVTGGYGYCLENLKGDYISLPDPEGNTGVFSKIRAFKSYGGGIIIWLIPNVGLKFDFRSIDIFEHKILNLPSRSFNRLTFGLCF